MNIATSLLINTYCAYRTTERRHTRLLWRWTYCSKLHLEVTTDTTFNCKSAAFPSWASVSIVFIFVFHSIRCSTQVSQSPIPSQLSLRERANAIVNHTKWSVYANIYASDSRIVENIDQLLKLVHENTEQDEESNKDEQLRWFNNNFFLNLIPSLCFVFTECSFLITKSFIFHFLLSSFINLFHNYIVQCLVES